MLFNVN